MSLLDRYVAVRWQSGGNDCDCDRGSADRRGPYRAAAMAALLLAVRLHGGDAGAANGPSSTGDGRRQQRQRPSLGARDLLRTSSSNGNGNDGAGGVTAEEIADAAKDMASALSWRTQAPTPACFVRRYAALLGEEDGNGDDDKDKDGGAAQQARARAQTEAAFLVEVSVCDGSFAGLRPSVVALAAMLCALDRLPPQLRRLQQQQLRNGGSSSSERQRAEFERAVEEATGLKAQSPLVMMARRKLWSIYAHNIDHHEAEAEDEADGVHHVRVHGHAQVVDGAAAGPSATAHSAPTVIPCDDDETVSISSSSCEVLTINPGTSITSTARVVSFIQEEDDRSTSPARCKGSERGKREEASPAATDPPTKKPRKF